MPFTMIEAPYRGDGTAQAIENNKMYLRLCLRDSRSRGEIPFASHAFFPFFLEEMESDERLDGIEMGYEFWRNADKIVFYTDYGMSPGMLEALGKAFIEGKPFEKRTILAALPKAEALPDLRFLGSETRDPDDSQSRDPMG